MIEHIKKCQQSLETIRTKDSKNLQLLIDQTQHKFEMLKITIESKNELFFVLQSQKHLDEIDDIDERTYEVCEAMTDETDLLMHLWNLDLKQSEKH